MKLMASVMIGGGYSPCAIALATLLSRTSLQRKRDSQDRLTSLAGLAFITEGAIPYAASDPLHVLPACIIGRYCRRIITGI